MRILSVTAQKPHSTGSGVYLTGTVCAFEELGHKNAVVAGITADDDVFFPEGVDFYPVYYNTPELPFPVCGMSDEMPYESTVYRKMDGQMTSRFESAFGTVLKRAVESFRPDVIVCHHLYLLTALVRGMFADIPVWGVCHGSDLRQLASNPLCRERIIAGIASLDRICSLHDGQKRQIMELFGVPEDKVRVVGTGYNSDIFRDMGLRRPHDGLRLIFAGKISEKKGVFSLISALGRLDSGGRAVSLRMAGGWGDDAQRDRALEAIRKSGLDITLLGRLSQSELAEEYSRADVFVLPSFYEGLPLVLAEALACGAGAVCTDLPGVRQWMDAAAPGNGVVYVPMPGMTGADTPSPSSLPEFETRLAEAIERAAALPKVPRDLTALSWQGVCGKILEKNSARHFCV